MAIQYASQSITITPGALASGSARESASVTSDNTLNVDDYRITVKVTLASGTIASPSCVFIWVKNSQDSGTTWDGNATSSDAAITLASPHPFALGGVLPTPTSAITAACSFSLKAACGGSIPHTWGIIIENRSGIAFSSSAVTSEKVYYT
jgi:hypothetical protein